MNAEKAVRDFLKGISETNNVYFVGSTTKNSIEYKAGEVMTFKLKVKTEDKDVPVPYIYYSCEGEDGVKTDGYAEPSADGWFYFDTSVNRDGFVHVIAKACDEDKKEIDSIDIFEGGAGADIDKIVTGTEEPSDYLEFWQWIRDETAKTEPEVIFKEKFEDERFPGFELYDMRIKTTGSEFASFFVTYPRNAQKGSLKLKMNFQGYGVCGNEYNAEDGIMNVSVNVHSIYNRQPDEYYDNLANGELKEFGFSNEENKNPKTTYWAKVFIRDMQVLRFIKDNPLLNGKDFMFSGGSMGGMQACNMAAHSGVATQCHMFIPWMADLGGTKNCNRLYGWRPDYTEGLKYFDTAIAAKYLKCPADIGAGLGDYVCPPSGEVAIYNAISSPKEIRFVQNQTHPYRSLEPIQYALCEK